jgi:methylenetetrahydrofolate dehydrogenase (NADP+)/methenyltetrahydrofolate cyclohydrolase
MLIDGKQTSHEILQGLKHYLEKIKLSHPHLRAPGLAFILVGDNKASLSYVKMKKKACESVGIYSEVFHLESGCQERLLLELIEKCNRNEKLDGILVQQPLPKHLDSELILESIIPSKDVDGFHPLNIGKTLLGHKDCFYSCTPKGILKLFEKYGIDCKGKHVVILGRSNIVGKPLAAILVQKAPNCNATVTIAHSHTKNLKELCKQADILVAAIGQRKFVTKEMVKPSAIVIDVGINLIEVDGKHKIVGDVDFENVVDACEMITPVPGGVGPMTIAMLLENTVEGFKRNFKL